MIGADRVSPMSQSLLRRLGLHAASRSTHEVKPGERYCRHLRARLTETATVLDLRQDSFGIMHVRFNVAFQRPDTGSVKSGPRMLALRTFVDAYRERVS